MKLTSDIDRINACRMYDFRSKGQRSRSQGSFQFLSTLWLRADLTDLFYTWFRYSPWRVNVSWSISRSRGQRSRSHRSFEIKVTLVIRSFCTIFRIKGQGHMGCSKVLRCPLCQGHTGHLKFLLYPFCGFVLFRPNHFVCGLHTTHEGAMCRAPFSRWNVKGQGQTRRSDFYLVRCMGSPLMLGDTD